MPTPTRLPPNYCRIHIKKYVFGERLSDLKNKTWTNLAVFVIWYVYGRFIYVTRDWNLWWCVRINIPLELHIKHCISRILIVNHGLTPCQLAWPVSALSDTRYYYETFTFVHTKTDPECKLIIDNVSWIIIWGHQQAVKWRYSSNISHVSGKWPLRNIWVGLS